MMCLSFPLPPEVAYEAIDEVPYSLEANVADAKGKDEDCEPQNKRCKTLE